MNAHDLAAARVNPAPSPLTRLLNGRTAVFQSFERLVELRSEAR